MENHKDNDIMQSTDNQKDMIDLAVDKFRTLLTEQLSRVEGMKNTDSKKQFDKERKVTIGIAEGDGIGPIIVAEAKRVIEYLLSEEIFSGKIVLKHIEGLTIENRMKLKVSVPDDTLKAIKECDVFLKGPTTTPMGGDMESANVFLRRELDLYANVRPVSIPEEGIDWTFFRENTEGEYALGSRGIEIPGKLCMDFKVTTRPGTERIARAAFDFAKNNNKTKLVIVTKANIMKKTDGSFSSIVHEVWKDYPEITVSDWYIDIMCANLLNPSRRADFEVFLLPNLYGDIITDEAAELMGGVGFSGSANIGDNYAMFEAIHGSAPRIIEEGRGAYANPSSMLRASSMLLNYIGRKEEAKKLDEVLNESQKEIDLIPNGKASGATAHDYVDRLLDKLKNLKTLT